MVVVLIAVIAVILSIIKYFQNLIREFNIGKEEFKKDIKYRMIKN